MNWKLIFQLSVFGLIMAIGTISLIPEKAEPAFWLAIFIFCSLVIAKGAPAKFFLHGFLVSMVNSVWITAFHIFFYSTYIANHPNVVKMAQQYAILPRHPRLAMLFTGPCFGILFGLVLGLFAYLASLLVRKKAATH